MAASVEPYLSIVGRAYEGRIKLPAFQREWKWKTSQVILLFDSLRQGFPVGGFQRVPVMARAIAESDLNGRP